MTKAHPHLASSDMVLTPPSRSLDSARLVLVSLIDPNPFQPRHALTDADVAELTASIRLNGVIEPLVVCPQVDRFCLIAGYRRLTASRQAGLSEVPCIVREGSDVELLELALVENIQRSDLTYLEEAESYQRLMDLAGIDQETVARRMNKSKGHVSERMALLKLPSDVKELLNAKRISIRTALELGRIADPTQRQRLASKVDKIGIEELRILVQGILDRQGKRRNKYEKHAAKREFKEIFQDLPIKRVYKDSVTFVFKEEEEFIATLETILKRWNSEKW